MEIDGKKCSPFGTINKIQYSNFIRVIFNKCAHSIEANRSHSSNRKSIPFFLFRSRIRLFRVVVVFFDGSFDDYLLCRNRLLVALFGNGVVMLR